MRKASFPRSVHCPSPHSVEQKEPATHGCSPRGRARRSDRRSAPPPARRCGASVVFVTTLRAGGRGDLADAGAVGCPGFAGRRRAFRSSTAIGSPPAGCTRAARACTPTAAWQSCYPIGVGQMPQQPSVIGVVVRRRCSAVQAAAIAAGGLVSTHAPLPPIRRSPPVPVVPPVPTAPPAPVPSSRPLRRRAPPRPGRAGRSGRPRRPAAPAGCAGLAAAAAPIPAAPPAPPSSARPRPPTGRAPRPTSWMCTAPSETVNVIVDGAARRAVESRHRRARGRRSCPPSPSRNR